MAAIQNIILPELALQTPLNMYFRVDKSDFDKTDLLESHSCYHYADKTLTLSHGRKYYFNSYYNGLSVNIWKQNCHVDTLSLKLRGNGRVQAELILMKHEFDFGRRRKNILVHTVLAQETVTLTAEGVCLPIAAWPRLTDGILYITLKNAAEGAEQAQFYGGSFETADTPPHDVKLGITITHFNRKHYVLPAIKRLERDILKHPYYGRYIDLAVVDNSRSITAAEAGGAAVLPNENYGGAGGFARGLLHFKDKNFSHCLFMDDDASCEIESVTRTLSLLQYARFENLAVSGAMLRETEPYLLWAKGESFRKFGITSPKRGLDMRKAADLLAAEEDKISPRKYGGFWHFAFPIAKTDYFPFPFFVRGDDMLFGVVNNFRVITLNGIGNFADDFSMKESPFIAYLHFRGEFLIDIITRAASPYFYIQRYKRMLRSHLYAYNYSHAHAYSMAAGDVMKGLSFWTENMDMTAIRQRLAKEAGGEAVCRQWQPAEGDMQTPHREERRLHKFLRKILWQGFLLPRFMIKRGTALVAKKFSGEVSATFRRETVFYYTDDLSHGYYAGYNKKRFFAEWRLSWKIRLHMAQHLKQVIADYKANWHRLASESFWRGIYGVESPAQLPPAAQKPENPKPLILQENLSSAYSASSSFQTSSPADEYSGYKTIS